MTPGRPSLPIALAIAHDARFIHDHAGAFERAGVELMEASLGQATSVALRWQPKVVVLTEDVYAFDPERFDQLAEIVGATIAWVPSEGAASIDVERAVARALAESCNARRAQDSSPTIPCGVRSAAPRQFGCGRLRGPQPFPIPGMPADSLQAPASRAPVSQVRIRTRATMPAVPCALPRAAGGVPRG